MTRVTSRSHPVVPSFAHPVDAHSAGEPTSRESDPSTGPVMTRRRRLGQTDLRVFPLAISGNVFGWTADVTAAESVLDTYAEFGGNFVDTADSYASGRSETMIGNWMRARRNRDELVIATKIGKSADNTGLSQRAIARAVDASLSRLGTETIDLLYLHVDDPAVPFEETLLAVDELVASGKVRHLGASDHSGNRLVEARVISAQLGARPIAALQSHYNLVHRREYEGTLATVAGQQRLAVMPRFALASGFLTGKYRSRGDIVRSNRGPAVSTNLTRRGMRVLAALDAVAAEHHVVPATIALAWLLTKPSVVAPVASAGDAAQVLDLVAASSVQLTRHQVAVLDRISA